MAAGRLLAIFKLTLIYPARWFQLLRDLLVVFLPLALHQLWEEHPTSNHIRVCCSYRLLIFHLQRHQLHVHYRLVLEASPKQHHLFLQFIASFQHSDLCKASFGFKLKPGFVELKDLLLLLAYKLVDRTRIFIEIGASEEEDVFVCRQGWILGWRCPAWGEWVNAERVSLQLDLFPFFAGRP